MPVGPRHHHPNQLRLKDRPRRSVHVSIERQVPHPGRSGALGLPRLRSLVIGKPGTEGNNHREFQDPSRLDTPDPGSMSTRRRSHHHLRRTSAEKRNSTEERPSRTSSLEAPLRLHAPNQAVETATQPQNILLEARRSIWMTLAFHHPRQRTDRRCLIR